MVLMAFGSTAVLVAGWQLGARPAAAPLSARPASGDTARTAPAVRPTTDSTGAAAPSRAASAPTGTFRGAVVQTQYGPVQVAVVVRNGRIDDVRALQLTDRGGRSVAISAAAAPKLRVEALTKQSAHIDTISGATYTSDGYKQSLQAALDRAGL